MRVGVTGHRQPRLGGYASCPWQDNIKSHMLSTLSSFKDDYDEVKLYSGMATGIDQWFAEAGLKLDLPVIGVVPYKGFGSRWPKAGQDFYHKLLDKCESVVYVSEDHHQRAFFDRDERLVNDIELLMAYYDYTPKGGTHHTIKYAGQVARDIIVYDVRTMK